MLIEPGPLESWVSKLLERCGYGADDAAYLATTLIDANSRGVDSHGVIRLPAYERRITEKLIDPAAVPLVTVNDSIVTVDANGASGQIAARSASKAVLKVSGQTGVAIAVVRSSAHFGAAGYYARWLADRGRIAIVVSNSEPAVVPFGGRDALLGTNPFAFAAPTWGVPISLDMATSASAMGKVMVAKATGQPIPDTWGVDEQGIPTTNANAIRALLPAGGPKGYGLAFVVEILGGVLSGAAIAHGLGNMYTDFSRPQDVGHWMMAVDVERFMSLNDFKTRIQSLINMAHATAPAAGFSEVLVPGEPEQRTQEQRARDGIPLPDATVDELRELGAKYVTPFPEITT